MSRNLWILVAVVVVVILVCLVACTGLDDALTSNPGTDATPVLTDEAKTGVDTANAVGVAVAPATEGLSALIATGLTNLFTLVLLINRQLIVSKQKRILASVDRNPNTPSVADQVNPTDIIL